MTTETQIKALWTPGWFELDQSLTLNHPQKFWFYRSPPDNVLGSNGEVGLVFLNQPSSTTDFDIRHATVIEMTHPQLGALAKIDTDGLDYLFIPVNGREVVVNAEEEPGTTYDGSKIADWSIVVQLTNVSEPINARQPE